MASPPRSVWARRLPPENAHWAKSGLAAEPLSRERSRYKRPFSAGPAAGQRRNPLRRHFKWPYTPRMTAESRVTFGGPPGGGSRESGTDAVEVVRGWGTAAGSPATP